MRHLFFDTETTGLPFNNLEPGHAEYPHIIQVGAILTDENFNVVNSLSTLVRLPPESVIHPKALEAHNITKEKANKYGVPCEVMLMMFNELLQQSDIQIAHNFKFDYLMMKKAEAYYFEKGFLSFSNPTCTMELTTNILKLPGKAGKFKWPKLEEAYEFYTKKKLEGAHDALVDVKACIEVYKYYVLTNKNGMKNATPICGTSCELPSHASNLASEQSNTPSD